MAKAKSVRFDRKRQYNPDDHIHIYKRLKSGEIMTKDAIAMIGVSERTYRRTKLEWEKILFG